MELGNDCYGHINWIIGSGGVIVRFYIVDRSQGKGIEIGVRFCHMPLYKGLHLHDGYASLIER